MKNVSIVLLAVFIVGCATTSNPIKNDRMRADIPVSAPAPLFVDPNYHGSCDPEIVWNSADKRWYIFYTARRATRESATYVGTPIGVISSANLADWKFEGYATFKDTSDNVVHVGRKDMGVTFWAPGMIVAGDRIHMFVTFKDNAEPPWAGIGHIRHYTTSLDQPLNGWELQKNPDFQQPDPIDATLIQNPATNQFHAYYRVAKRGGIQWSTSDDLMNWTNHGKVQGDVNTLGRKRFGYQEAPYVFRFEDRWWLITDPHKGLAVYESSDGKTWTFNNVILKGGSNREMDSTMGRHPSVAQIEDRVFIFYHVEPNRDYVNNPKPAQRTIEQKKSVLQMAELVVEEGRLKAVREQKIMLP